MSIIKSVIPAYWSFTSVLEDMSVRHFFLHEKVLSVNDGHFPVNERNIHFTNMSGRSSSVSNRK